MAPPPLHLHHHSSFRSLDTINNNIWLIYFPLVIHFFKYSSVCLFLKYISCRFEPSLLIQTLFGAFVSCVLPPPSLSPCPSLSSLLPLCALSIVAIWGCRPMPPELQIYPAAHVTNRGAPSSQNSPNSSWWKGGPSGSYQGLISNSEMRTHCPRWALADAPRCLPEWPSKVPLIS